MCWKDGFSIKWLANFSSSMANSQYNIYKNQNVPWKLSTKWLFVPYRMVRFGAQKLWFLQQKIAKPSQTHCLLQNGIPRPHFFHRMEGRPQPFCGGNGKGINYAYVHIYVWMRASNLQGKWAVTLRNKRNSRSRRYHRGAESTVM